MNSCWFILTFRLHFSVFFRITLIRFCRLPCSSSPLNLSLHFITLSHFTYLFIKSQFQILLRPDLQISRYIRDCSCPNIMLFGTYLIDHFWKSFPILLFIARNFIFNYCFKPILLYPQYFFLSILHSLLIMPQKEGSLDTHQLSLFLYGFLPTSSSVYFLSKLSNQ